MRVRDWREHGGLDVIAHLLFRSGGVDTGVLDDLLEARGAMLREVAALAAGRRDDAQAARLVELAGGGGCGARRRGRPAGRLRLLHRAGRGLGQRRVRADPELDPRAVLRARRGASGDGSPRGAGAALRAGGARRGRARQRRRARGGGRPGRPPAGAGEGGAGPARRVDRARQPDGRGRPTSSRACSTRSWRRAARCRRWRAPTPCGSSTAGLAASPRLNRIGLRALLYALERRPRLLGWRGAAAQGLPEWKRAARVLDAARQRLAAGRALSVELIGASPASPTTATTA